MAEILSIALASMQLDMKRLDSVAQNLANASTPGYRSSSISASSGNISFNQMVRAIKVENPIVAKSSLNLTPGSLRVTNQPLDLALASSGYFEVKTGDGIAYTRQGDFKIDTQGRLATQTGHTVSGNDGPIYLKRPDPAIDDSGQVFEWNAEASEKRLVGKIKIVEIENPSALRAVGSSLWVDSESNREENSTNIKPSGNFRLKQGNLENSNTKSMNEMISLIQVMRHFESMQKITQGYDEMLGTSIRKLGDVG
ncbi:flagellar hook-basal body protein [Acidovorax facilis]|uniref:flagellar hook-basal body protein n=1 Tax=Acidovorax facilis TaxID=12917 RepID=UPI003CFAE85B